MTQLMGVLGARTDVVGMNLLLRSGTGFDGTGFEKTHEAPCTSVLIDGPRWRLGIRLGPGRTP